MVDRKAERMRAAALEEETVRSCCVLVPLVRLPEDTRVWCLYHCQYECPCKSYKSPLDYAPDRNIRRAMPKCKKEALRAGGQGKASPKKAAAAAAGGGGPSLAGLPRGPKSAKLRAAAQLRRQSADRLSAPPPLTHPASQSARTAGYDIKRNVNDLKLPHKIVKGTKKPTLAKKPAEAKKGAAAAAAAVRKNQPGEIDLSMRPKDEKQFVRWGDFKSAFDEDRIVVYVHHRNGRPNIFVARPAEAPYVTNAENVKLIDDLRLMGLPPTIQNLVRKNVPYTFDPTDDGEPPNDEEKYAILNHNGIAWELNGVMQKKVRRSEADQIAQQQQQLQQKRRQEQEQQRIAAANAKAAAANANAAAPFSTPATTTSSFISAETQVMKLPRGQNLVTMQRAANSNQTMQIKLPPTTERQHWCTIRVQDDSQARSVQCPDSTLALKCSILKEATGLAMKEETTVRIPIPVPGEVEDFGVYAVPGLPRHVFVGPFTNRVETPAAAGRFGGGSDDIICLDSPEPTKTPEEDDVQASSIRI